MQDQFARNFLEQMLAEQMVAGSPSFEIGPSRGDARRSRKAEMGGGDMIAQGGIPVGDNPLLPFPSQEAFRQYMRENRQRPALGAPQAPYDSELLQYLLRGA